MSSNEEYKSDAETDAEEEVSENNETSRDEQTEYMSLLVVKLFKACKSTSPSNNETSKYYRKINEIT